MDDMHQFLAQQRALAEMPDEGMDEYELRTRRSDKRRKLWNSIERHSRSPSQTAREASEFSDLVDSLTSHGSSGNVSHAFPIEKKGRRISFQEEDAPCGKFTHVESDGFDMNTVSTPATSKAHTSSDVRVHLDVYESSKSVGRKGSEDAAPSSHEQTPPSLLAAVMPRLSDNARETKGSGRVNLEHLPPDQESHLTLSSRQQREAAHFLNNQQSAMREKALKKVPDSDKANISNVSNITSPSTTPLGSYSASSRTTGVPRPRPTLDSVRKAQKEQRARKAAEAVVRKKEEAEERLMTPTEYAAKVQTKFGALLEKASSKQLFLRDKVIFYIGGDYKYASKRTREKMDFLRKKGATVLPTYDPKTVTHIVTDAADVISTLKALGVKSLDEIPMHIPTVKWSWISSGASNTFAYLLMHAAFASRIDADPNKASEDKGKRKAATAARPVIPADDDFSRIEDFTVADHTVTPDSVSRPQLRSDAHAPSSKVQLTSRTPVSHTNSGINDPLAEFYAQAMKDRDAERYNSRDSEDSDDELQPVLKNAQKSRFTCDQKGVNVGNCVNQDIVDKLTELMELTEPRLGEENRWRTFSYKKSIRAIRNYPKRIRSYEEALSIKGVGEKTALKVKEIIDTGGLRRIEFENTEDVRVVKLFLGIYGVGPNIAYKWYASGCRTLEDIKQRKGGIKLSGAQEIGLKFYDGEYLLTERAPHRSAEPDPSHTTDINTRIPRSEAKDIFNMIKSIALGIDPKLFIEIMGSYRRGKETCGDIDILITRPTDDGKTHYGILRRLLRELHLNGILTEDLAIPEDLDSPEGSYRGLCRRDESSRRRRIDILSVYYVSRGAALLYYTGDDIFNRAIRYKAGQMGYSLNQRGLFTNVIRDVNDRRRKLTPGLLVASETEEEIFEILGVPWQEPHERVRSPTVKDSNADPQAIWSY